ncbi:MAG: hypothetical protein LBG27_04135 [Spirochaetaceae bacterium]|nr:hypothetical protein [Spirochaetaceae bacterium]
MKLRLKGKRLTKQGPLLKHQIPSGSITTTNAYSGWTEERSLHHHIHRRVKKEPPRSKTIHPFLF